MIAQEISKLLRGLADPARAEHSQRYFKTGKGEYEEREGQVYKRCNQGQSTQRKTDGAFLLGFQQSHEFKFLGTEPDYSQTQLSRKAALFVFKDAWRLCFAIQLPALPHKLFSLLSHALAERDVTINTKIE